MSPSSPEGGAMTRSIGLMISIMLFFGASVLTCAQTHSRTLVIENVGVADHLIIPMVISNSSAGIVSGRQIILQDTGSDFDMVRSHVVSADTFEKMIKHVQKAEDDGDKSLKEFGTLRFVILSDGKTAQAILLGRENGIRLLKSLGSVTGPGTLRKSLTNLRDEVTTATGPNKP